MFSFLFPLGSALNPREKVLLDVLCRSHATVELGPQDALCEGEGMSCHSAVHSHLKGRSTILCFLHCLCRLVYSLELKYKNSC